MTVFLLCALLSGALFGTGLVLSGMTDPARVIGFLDVFGRFDPRLAFVLGGAVTVTLVTYRLILRADTPLAAIRGAEGSRDRCAARGGCGHLRSRLGHCRLLPGGPAAAGLGIGSPEAIVFVLALLAGSAIHRWNPLRKRQST
jgi:uncharacterized protein